MNLLLLFPEDFISPDTVCITDRRLAHLQGVKQVRLNDVLEVGLVNQQLGKGQISFINNNRIELNIALTHQPPPPLPVHLILALPRPKMLKRVLQTVSAMGVKRLTLIHSYRVEKSYWQSPLLEQDKLLEQLVLGLEQARDTVLPELDCFRRFKPFVEDVLADWVGDSRAIVAHPGRGKHCQQHASQPDYLAVGPEGGFTDYEVDKLIAAGFECCHLGPRILRVENAIPVLLAHSGQPTVSE
jgi:RsmE family RNA methyltransferase